MAETQIDAVRAELAEWCHPTAPKSHWNDLHGSVTGDYAGMFERTATADEAQIRYLLAKLAGLQALKGGPNA